MVTTEDKKVELLPPNLPTNRTCACVVFITIIAILIGSVVYWCYWPPARSPLEYYLLQLKELYESEPDVPVIKVLWRDTNRTVEYIEPVLRDAKVLVDEQQLGITNSPRLKKSLSLRDVFDIETGKGSRVIVQSRAGGGKTTMLHRLTKMWLQGEIWTGCKVLLKIPLRRSTYENVSCIEEEDNLHWDLFSLCGIISQKHHKVDLDAVIKEVEMKEVCILLDGVDEYVNAHQHCEDVHSLIYKVITGGVDSDKEVLPHVTLVVTSRSTVLNEGILNGQHVLRKIEIVGFDEEGIKEFVVSFFRDSPEKSSTLIEELKQNLEIRYVCYNPLLLTFLVYIHALGGKLPKTETGIHIAFVTASLKKEVERIDMERHLTRPCRYLKLSSYESIDNCSRKLGHRFRETTMLAYSGTFKFFISLSKDIKLQVIKTDFSWSEVPEGLLNTSFGFLFSNDAFGSPYNRGGMSGIHSFLHSVTQEFLAAFYITQLDKDQQMDVILEAVGRQAVDAGRYYCGLFGTSFHDESLLSHFIRNNAYGDSVECAFQSHSSFTVAETVAAHNHVLDCYNVFVYEWPENEIIIPAEGSCPHSLDYCSDLSVINLSVRNKWDFYVSQSALQIENIILHIGPACLHLYCGIFYNLTRTSATVIEIDTSPQVAEYMPRCLKEHQSQAMVLLATFKSLGEKAPNLTTVTVQGTWTTSAEVVELLIHDYKEGFFQHLQEIIIVDFGMLLHARSGVLLSEVLNTISSLKRLRILTDVYCCLESESKDESKKDCYMSDLYLSYLLANWQLKEILTHKKNLGFVHNPITTSLEASKWSGSVIYLKVDLEFTKM